MLDPILRRLGWDAFWDDVAKNVAKQHRIGRVTQGGVLLRVNLGSTSIWAEPLRRSTAMAPDAQLRAVCGDWVAIEPLLPNSADGPAGRVRAILPRRTSIAHQERAHRRDSTTIANADEIWVVCGVDRDPGLRNLLRYQTITRATGVPVLIVLNKIDQVETLEPIMIQAQVMAPGLPVAAVSATCNLGIPVLQARFSEGRTIVLLGASGVGKSTLLNLLAGADTRTRPVRESDARGRHTTTSSLLIATAQGALLMDTPGWRALHVPGPSLGFERTFDDVERHARFCRFRDCRHDSEPNCAVRAALQSGIIVPQRFLAYLELRQERQLAQTSKRECRTASGSSRKNSVKRSCDRHATNGRTRGGR